MADAGDLKSPGGDPIRVRVPARASGGGVGVGGVASPCSFRGLRGCEDGRQATCRGSVPRTTGWGSLRTPVAVLFRADRLRFVITRGIRSRKRDCCTSRGRRSNQVSFVSRSITGLIGWSGAVGLWQLGGAVAAASACGRHSGAGNRDPGDGTSGGLATTVRLASAGRWRVAAGRDLVPAAGLPD